MISFDVGMPTVLVVNMASYLAIRRGRGRVGVPDRGIVEQVLEPGRVLVGAATPDQRTWGEPADGIDRGIGVAVTGDL
jgi:hypothetical protein